jgi:trimeric autotransporter adhesin
MKTRMFLLVGALLLSTFTKIQAQGSAFTYQGQLMESNTPANGSYDLQFIIYDASVGGSEIGPVVTNTATPVVNGLFTVTLDFGAGIFTGSNDWLDIAARTNGSGTFTELSPRQQLTPTPYAIFAEGADATGLTGTIPTASLSGTYAGRLNLTNIGNSFAGNGASLASVNAAALNGLNATNFWQTAGNSGTIAGVNFAGTLDNQPFEIHVNGLRALRLEPPINNPNISNAVNVIEGSAANYVLPGIQGATIGGGGAPVYFGTGTSNSVADNFGTIGGGVNNKIQTNAYESTISGGNANTLISGAYRSTIAGGWANSISTDHSVISGGVFNTIESAASFSVIGGGYDNKVETNNEAATIAGGYTNVIEAGSGFSGIGGGFNNSIQAEAAFSFIGSGQNNTIESNNFYTTIAGGYHNVIQTNSGDSVISGGYGNTIQAGSVYAFIGGGDNNTVDTNNDGAAIAGGYGNQIQPGAGYSFIGSGDGNIIQSNSSWSSIGSGIGNTVGGGLATVGGGYKNILSNSVGAFIGGGYQNVIQPDAFEATIAGGWTNFIGSNAEQAVVAGGHGNQATNLEATVPGGQFNIAGGEYSFAAGQQAQALHQGAFVWADSQNAPFSSTTNDEFSIRSQNGVHILSSKGIHFGAADDPIVVRDWDPFAANAPANKVGIGRWGLFMEPDFLTIGIPSNDIPSRYFQIAKYSTNGYLAQLVQVDQSGNIIAQGTVTANGVLLTSDRNAKENFRAVDGKTVLAKVVALPVTEWNYKQDAANKHIGPVAQDFHAAFQLDGADDKHISVIDEGGVAISAIQGLNQKMEERDQRLQAQLKEKDEEIQELKQRLEKVEQWLARDNGGMK